jgi:hypothetical protein
VYIGNSIPPIAQNAMESSRTKKIAGKSIKYNGFVGIIPLNNFVILVSKNIL